MAIYTASYFCPQHHHGTLIAISRSVPKGFVVEQRLPMFAPSKALLEDWKAGGLDEVQYTDRFREELRPRLGLIRDWLNAVQSGEAMTLLCWERPGEFCHRNLILKLIRKFRPECWGGADVPAVVSDRPIGTAGAKPMVIAPLQCPTCAAAMIPGCDYSFCPTCRVWLRTPVDSF